MEIQFPAIVCRIFTVIAGPECTKILKKLEELEPRVPPEHAPFLTALKALRGLNQMANLVGWLVA